MRWGLEELCEVRFRELRVGDQGCRFCVFEGFQSGVAIFNRVGRLFEYCVDEPVNDSVKRQLGERRREWCIARGPFLMIKDDQPASDLHR